MVHVERFNNTLRQRLARFVRKTLSFSKCVVMHLLVTLLFLFSYNLDRATRYLAAQQHLQSS